MLTAWDLVADAARRFPSHLALVDDRSERRLTFAQLIAEAETLAAGLAERGVQRGTRVATALPNLFEHCLVLLALSRLGAVPALLNFRLKPSEIAQLLAEGEIEGAVVLPDEDLVVSLESSLPHSELLFAVGGGVALDIFSCRGDARRLPPLEVGAEEAAFLFYTSGTTGLPKAAVLAHRTSLPRTAWLETTLGEQELSLRSLGCSPLSHAIGFHGVFLPTLARGGTYYTMSSFDPKAAIDLIDRHRINFLFSLPTLFSALVAAPNYAPERVHSLEWALWGGAPIPPRLLDRLAREWRCRFVHIYGTTEAMLILNNPHPLGESTRLLATPGVPVRVVASRGADDEAALGQPGELLVEASVSALWSGYLNRPEATTEKLHDGWYWTGDAAVRHADGSFELQGRLDDLIRSGGEFVQPEEVETVLAAHPSVESSAVVGKSDDHWGQVVTACVVTKDDVAAIDLDAYCRASTLANYKRPRAYLFLEALPTTTGGKLQRQKLREMVETAVGKEQARGRLEIVR
jgi:acyl-CoA synthetase (AMP-forming)/AMP-acid ligase II